jgi:hypothetical protein
MYRLTSQDAMSIQDQAQIERKSVRVEAGSLVPAVVVRVRVGLTFSIDAAPRPLVNLSLLLDGTLNSWWCPSVAEGDRPGEWSWPTRV